MMFCEEKFFMVEQAFNRQFRDILNSVSLLIDDQRFSIGFKFGLHAGSGVATGGAIAPPTDLKLHNFIIKKFQLRFDKCSCI